MSKHLVYVGIGSNIEQEKYLRIAAQSLKEHFGEGCQLQLSPVYKTRAVGFDGDDFFNLVATRKIPLTFIVKSIRYYLQETISSKKMIFTAEMLLVILKLG